MPEIDEKTLLRRRWTDEGPYAVYFYTPWCGTCKIGERMLDVVLAMEPGRKIYKANVNFMPTIVPEWKIESVPALVFVAEEGRRAAVAALRAAVGTMRSVEHVLKRIRERLD